MTMMDKAQKEYAFKHKIIPFLRGMALGGPCVEVAVEGLRRGVGEPLSSRYESRIIRRGDLRHIAMALESGLDERCQEGMAAAFRKRFESEKERCSVVAVGGHPGIPGAVFFMDVRGRYMFAAMQHAFGIVSSGKLSSQAAQAELADLVCDEGKPIHAKLFLESGNLTSEAAISRLRSKMAQSG